MTPKPSLVASLSASSSFSPLVFDLRLFPLLSPLSRLLPEGPGDPPTLKPDTSLAPSQAGGEHTKQTYWPGYWPGEDGMGLQGSAPSHRPRPARGQQGGLAEQERLVQARTSERPSRETTSWLCLVRASSSRWTLRGDESGPKRLYQGLMLMLPGVRALVPGEPRGLAVALRSLSCMGAGLARAGCLRHDFLSKPLRVGKAGCGGPLSLFKTDEDNGHGWKGRTKDFS